MVGIPLELCGDYLEIMNGNFTDREIFASVRCIYMGFCHCDTSSLSEASKFVFISFKPPKAFCLRFAGQMATEGVRLNCENLATCRSPSILDLVS